MIAALRRYIFGPIARTLLRVILREWSLDRYDVASAGAHKFGHLALEPLVGHLESQRREVEGRKVLWTLGPRRNASNPSLHALWRRELQTYPRHLVGLAISPNGPHLLPTSIYSSSNVLDNYPWRPRLTTGDRELGRRFLLDHGWDGKRPLVGIVVNEGLHYGRTWHNYETAVAPELRVLTFGVEEFVPVMAELVRQGATVVRLGAPPATPLSVSQPDVIDYATTSARSSTLDVVLPGLMSTVFSTQTGPDAVALMFGVPVTYFDVARIKYCFFDVSTVHWQPAVLETSDGRRLPLCDLLRPEYLNLKTPDDFASQGITVRRASTSDRVATAMEGIQRQLGTLILDDRDRELQDAVRRAFASARKQGVLVERGDASAMLSPHFLRRNSDWFLRGV